MTLLLFHPKGKALRRELTHGKMAGIVPGGYSLFKPYLVYVPLQRVVFCAVSVSETGLDFAHFGRFGIRYGFRGIYGGIFIVLIPTD